MEEGGTHLYVSMCATKRYAPFWAENWLDFEQFWSENLKMSMDFTETGMASRDLGCLPFTQTTRMEFSA